MKSIKEKSEELYIAFRKEQGDVGYSEQLSYKLGIEAGANYVIDEIERIVNSAIENKSMTIPTWRLNFIIKQLKK